MPSQKSLVYADPKKNGWSPQRLPAFCWASLTLLTIALCIPVCRLSAQQHPPVPNADQSRDVAASQNPGNDMSVHSENVDHTEPARTEQQLQIAQQSAGLLQMAKDLKAEVDVTTSDTLSVTAFRKADAIERFVQNVKDKNKHTNRKP